MDFKTWAVVADNHGDQIHGPTASRFFDWLDDYKPQVRVHLGDNWNFDCLRTGASEKDRAVDLAEDVQQGFQFLERFFDGGDTKVFLRGNHDERLWRLLDHPCSALAREYGKDLTRRISGKVRELNARMLPYDAQKGVFKIGRLKCLHGYAHGVGASRAHANIYGECVFGHVHRFDSAGVPSHEGRRYARSIGCLAGHRLGYCVDKTYPLGWHHGWAYGIVYPNGDYTFNEAIVDSKGRVAVATGFKVL